MAINQREMWYEVIKSWCNNTFDGVDVDLAPLDVQKCLDILITTDANKSYGKSSATVQGVLVESFTPESLPPIVRSILSATHRKIRFD